MCVFLHLFQIFFVFLSNLNLFSFLLFFKIFYLFIVFLSLPKGQPKKISSDGHSPAQELEVRPHCVFYLLVILKTLKSLAIHFDHGKNILQHIVSDCDIPHVIFVTFFVFL